MKQDKMYLINKLFNNNTIRTVWDDEKEKYYVSVVDVVGILSGSSRPRKYWSDLKKNLIEEGHNQLSEKIGQLKLKSSDGKYYNTDVWKERGIKNEVEYSILTNEMYKEWSGMTTIEYKKYKGLRKESLRDKSDLEVALADLGELTTKEVAKKEKPYGLKENKKVAKRGGKVAGNTRRNIEKELGNKIITKDKLIR